MTSLPSQHPTLSLHLTDTALTPLITSSTSPTHFSSLTSLTSSALTSQTAVQRAGLGRPQRIMVEYPDRGAVVLQTYLDPPATNRATHHHHQQLQSEAEVTSEEQEEEARGNATPLGTERNGSSREHLSTTDSSLDGAERDNEEEDAAPMLVGVVVAGSADDAREARKAAARLERVGRQLQKEWAREAGGGGGGGDAYGERRPISSHITDAA